MKRFCTLAAAGLLGLAVITPGVAAQGQGPRPGLNHVRQPLTAAAPNSQRSPARQGAAQIRPISPVKARPTSSPAATFDKSRRLQAAGTRTAGQTLQPAGGAAAAQAAGHNRLILPNSLGKLESRGAPASDPGSRTVPGRGDLLSASSAVRRAAAGGKLTLQAKPEPDRSVSAAGGKLTDVGRRLSGAVRSGAASAAEAVPGKDPNRIKPRSESGAAAISPANRPRLHQGAGSSPPGPSGPPKALIITDEDGNEHWQGTLDEELAINAGGTYEWTDADGGRHVTEVTPEGTRRTYTNEEEAVASESFTPHERREAAPETGNADVDLALTIVGGILSGVAPYFRGVGEGVYYQPEYVLPEYVLPVDPGYVGIPAVAVVPGTAAAGDNAAAGAAEQGLARFTQRLLHVRNNSGEPIQVFVQFRSQAASGEWSWWPADPAVCQDALVFEVAAGQEGCLEHHGVPISASRVRIWGQSAGRQWTTYRDEDLWLVSEVDASGQRAYLARQMETYPFLFE